ncbi:MAG: isoaspartyl peptidase/L-asparaginase [Halanaeroarchaeum sp.]
MRVIAHGGAGSVPDDPDARRSVLESAVENGVVASTPLDAVVATIEDLEADDRFNAGLGSWPQSDGIARTDAGLMTADREVGAACSMPGVEHASSVARVVMEETPHVLVSGVHAVDLAADFGIETGVDLWSDRTRGRWDDLEETPTGGPSDHLDWLQDRFGGHDTVGAVAVDGDRVAAGTSTGGRWLALAGRVGDVPQVGSGFYAAPAGGASATGSGEDIARVTLTRRAVDHLESGYDAQSAADLAIEEFEDVTGSDAGVIVADVEGTVGSAFNTAAMQTATARR